MSFLKPHVIGIRDTLAVRILIPCFFAPHGVRLGWQLREDVADWCREHGVKHSAIYAEWIITLDAYGPLKMRIRRDDHAALFALKWL